MRAMIRRLTRGNCGHCGGTGYEYGPWGMSKCPYCDNSGNR